MERIGLHMLGLRCLTNLTSSLRWLDSSLANRSRSHAMWWTSGRPWRLHVMSNARTAEACRQAKVHRVQYQQY